MHEALLFGSLFYDCVEARCFAFFTVNTTIVYCGNGSETFRFYVAHWKRDMFRFLLVNTTILNSIYCGNGSEIFRFDVAHCQRRNSYELYPVRAGGTQTIGLPGGHPELSCPAALFI
jgi:hypothetical protein